MRKASQLFSKEQREQVKTAVAAAEAKTSCEIVPVVATSSGRYDRAEDVVGVWLATIAAVVVWLSFPRIMEETGSWEAGFWDLGLIALIVVIVVGFITGAFLGSRVDWLRRLFTPRNQMRNEVAARAREVFFDQRVHHTTGATGILIYVSLFERTAAVLGDQEVIEKLGQAALDHLCQQLTEGLRQSDPTTAICAVIEQAGNQLAKPLPRAADDVNELADALVLMD
ncbi:hypothetical protein GC197_12485 [bacterium]|nr:hypothetical protein [bacterium]